MNNLCDKLILAESAGIRLIYCKNCNVIELEMGAISLRLSPEHTQQIANTMMKASLRLDRMTSLSDYFSQSPGQFQIMH